MPDVVLFTAISISSFTVRWTGVTFSIWVSGLTLRQRRAGWGARWDTFAMSPQQSVSSLSVNSAFRSKHRPSLRLQGCDKSMACVPRCLSTCVRLGDCVCVWSYCLLCRTSEARASPASSQRQWVKNNVVCSEWRGARRRQLGARPSYTHTSAHTHLDIAAALYGSFFFLWISHSLT